MEDKLKYMRVDDLIPYKNNPRNNDEAVEYVAKSIEEFGFKVPIVVDKNNVIVAGHTRLKASKKLGLDKVPVIIADDLSDEKIKAFRLVDNKVAEIAVWKEEELHQELTELEEMLFDMTQFGFEDLEFDLDTEVEEDNFEEGLPEQPKAKQGDVYQLGEHRLMCGDSTNSDDIKTLINGEHINLMLTDPPYGIDIVQNSKVGGGGETKFGKVGGHFVEAKDYLKIKGDDTTETARKACALAGDLVDNSIIFGGNYFTDFLPPSPCWIVWDKENTGNFADVELAWTSFDKSAKLYRWLWNGMSRKGDHKTEGATRVHPTQKPVGLMGGILKDFSNEGESVLDLFGGSGSTLIACEQLGIKCYIMEFEPAYVDVIINRWEQFTGQEAKLIEEEA